MHKKILQIIAISAIVNLIHPVELRASCETAVCKQCKETCQNANGAKIRECIKDTNDQTAAACLGAATEENTKCQAACSDPVVPATEG